MRYADLEGKEVIVDFGYHIAHGVITGCERDIGITVQEKETNKYLFCLNGPLSPIIKKTNKKWKNKKKFRSFMFWLAKQLQTGHITFSCISSQYSTTGNKIGSGASVNSCPFSQ